MDTIVVTWRELLIIIALVLTVYIAEMLLLMRAGGGLRKPRWLSIIEEKRYETELRQQIEALQKRVSDLESESVPKSSMPTQPLSSAEFGWSVVPTPPLIPPIEDDGTADLEQENAFQRAVKMAEKGSTADVLVEECGISHSEADMIIALHKP